MNAKYETTIRSGARLMGGRTTMNNIPADDTKPNGVGRNPFYDEQILRLLMNSLPPAWTERQKEYQARLQYADVRHFLVPRGAQDSANDIIEKCLRAFHGSGSHGWGLLKQQWPETAVIEQIRKMADVVVIAQSDSVNEVLRLSRIIKRAKEALEAVRSEIPLPAQLGDIVDEALDHE